MEFFKYDTKDNYKKGNFKKSHVLHEVKINNPEIPKNIFIVTSENLSTVKKNAYLKFFENELDDFLVFGGYTFLYGLNTKLNKGTSITKEVVFNYTCDFKKYISPNSIIFSLDDATKLLTFDSSIKFTSFSDDIFNKTYCYLPELESWIFPVPDFEILKRFDQDKEEYTKNFWHKQIKLINKLNLKKPRIPKLNLIHIKDPDTFFLEHMEEKEVAWDIETSGLDFISDRIGYLTMSFDGVTGYFMFWSDIKDKSLLDKFFENKYQIGANLRFDCLFLRQSSIKNCKIDFDTLNAGHVLNEMRSNSLKTHAFIYTYFGGYDKPLELLKRKYKKANYLELPFQESFTYATMDAIVTFQVYKKMKKQLADISKKFYGENAKHTLETYYYNEVIPALNTFTDIELNGALINWDKLDKLGQELEIEINKIKDRIYKYFNISLIETYNLFLNSIEEEAEINVDSNYQISDKLDELKWPCYGRTKSGHYLINDETLKKWVQDGYEGAEILLDYHAHIILQKTFVGKKEDKSGMWKYKRKDGRIHPSFLVFLADSGRNRCKAPNLQNQVKRGKWAKKFKAVFTVPDIEKYYLAEMDASGFQLRIGAILSDDENMKDVFVNKGGDLHSMTAASVVLNNKYTFEEFLELKKTDEEVKLARYRAKSCNFALEFNCTGTTLARQSIEPEWNLDACKKYVIDNQLTRMMHMLKDRMPDFEEDFYYYWAVALDVKKKFFQTYPQLLSWIESQIDFAKQKGYIISTFGLIRRLNYLKNPDKDNTAKIKNLQNIAVNSQVQTYEAVLMNRLITRLHRFLKDNNMNTRIFNGVHDSVVTYLYKEEFETVFRKAKELFEVDLPENNDIPLLLECDLADLQKGECWGFGKEIEI